MDGALKNQNVPAVEPVFLSPLVYQIKGFGHLSALAMPQHFLSSYMEIDEIGLEENDVKMMGTYDPAEAPDRLIEELEKGGELAQQEGRRLPTKFWCPK